MAWPRFLIRALAIIVVVTMTPFLVLLCWVAVNQGLGRCPWWLCRLGSSGIWCLGPPSRRRVDSKRNQNGREEGTEEMDRSISSVPNGT